MHPKYIEVMQLRASPRKSPAELQEYNDLIQYTYDRSFNWLTSCAVLINNVAMTDLWTDLPTVIVD